MSFSETIFLFLLALVIFGPKKLPEIARQVGKWMNEFRRASNEFKAQIEQEIANLEVEKRQTILPPSPTPDGTASRSLNPAPSAASESAEPTNSTPADTTPAAADESKSPEASATEAPATLAQTTDVPVPKNGAEHATEAVPAADTVGSSTSQESHA